MKIIEEPHGDLLTDKEVSVILHQVKNINRFDTPLAAQIRVKYPDSWKADVLATEKKNNKLGSYSVGWGVPHKTIYNIYSHANVPNEKNYTDYNALRTALKSIKNHLTINENSPVIGMGRIGTCVGGDWSIIKGIIEDVFQDYENKVKIFNTPGA